MLGADGARSPRTTRPELIACSTLSLLDIPAERRVTVNEDQEQVQEWLRQNPRQVQEWLRQNNLIYGGLIAVGVAMVQPFLTAASLDLSARICIVAFSVAIPLLAALVLVNRQEAFRRRATRSVLVATAQVVAQLGAFVGVVAGFWHILWVAGVGMLASGIVAVAVYSAGYVRLERDQGPAPQETEEPGDTEP
jgi:hypothetical protein